MHLAQDLRNQFEKIVLRPKLSTIGDYIDQLIEIENDKPHRNKHKIAELKKAKKRESIKNRINR